jgi:hypothetical protein
VLLVEDDGGDRYFSLLVVIPPEVLETRDAEEVINAVETVLYGDEMKAKIEEMIRANIDALCDAEPMAAIEEGL